jgi:hypothetical protein
MLSCVAAVILTPKYAPLNTVLGNVDVTKRPETRIIRNPKSKYFLFTALDCDGAHVVAVLTRDKRTVEHGEFPVVLSNRLTTRVFREIKIDDQKSKVTQILGEPRRRKKSGQFEVHRYFKLFKNGNDQRYLVNDYVYKQNRLIEASIHYESVPGCGETFDPNVFHTIL